MKTTKSIRYIGLCMLILSSMVLMYLFSFSLFKETKASTADQNAVLVISSDTSGFPKTDYDILFSKLNLISDSVRIDAAVAPDVQQVQISDALKKLNSNHIILFAREDACIPALSAALSNSGISSVILLSPNLAGNAALETFGTREPNIPVAIFDVNTQYSTALYERLSGEDATLLPGLKSDGKFTAEVFISPDSSRYLSQWDFLGQSKFAQSLIAFLPEVQIKTGDYITTYVLNPAAVQNVDIRSEVAVIQAMKILAATFLAAGLLLFFASIPRPGRNIPGTAGRQDTGKPDTEDAGILQAAMEGPPPAAEFDRTERMADAINRMRGRVFIVSAITAAAFSAVLLILYSLDLRIAPELLASWPLFYYAVCAVFFLRFFPKTIAGTKVPAKRILFSGCLLVFFAAGIFLLTSMHSVSLGTTFSGAKGALLLLLFLMLLVLSWVRMSTDLRPLHEKYQTDNRKARLRGWYQHIILVFPYVVLAGYLLATGRKVLSLQCAFLLTVLLTGIWIRHIFRRTSGTEWIAAFVFSFFYLLIAFG